MAFLKLTVDQHAADLWDVTQRHALLNTSRGIESLEWTYKVADGGYWDGKVTLRLDPSGRSYDWLVRMGLVGVARIWWVRDEGDASGVDDASELLWLGILEDAREVAGTELVEFQLRGVGQFLEDILITRSFEGEKIGDAVKAVLDDVIAASGSPVTGKDVDISGACQRRITMEFDGVPARRALKDLAAQAGGQQRIAWGVRTGDDSDDQGIAYFKLWTGHLWEKDSTVEDRSFSIPASGIVKKEVITEISDIVNAVTVIGGEIPQHEDAAERKFFTATAEAKDSVLRYGRRETVIEDSDLVSDGQCALVAAAELKEKANRSVEVSLDALVDLQDKSTGSNEAQGLIQSTLKWPGTLTVARDENRPFSAWGDSQDVYHAERDTSDKSYLRIDTDAAPGGSDAPLKDLTSAWSPGDERLYWQLQTRPTPVTPFVALNVMELDRAVGLVWLKSGGGGWLLRFVYRDASHNWVLAGSGTTTRSDAELANPHLVGLKVVYQSATQFVVRGYHYDTANGAVALTDAQILNHADISSQATTDRIYVNAVASTGIDSFYAPADGDSQDGEFGYFAAMGGVPNGATFTSFLDDIGLKHFPYKHYDHLLLHTNFGQQKAGKGFVRFAYPQTDMPGKFAAEPMGAAGKSEIISVPAAFNSFRAYSWMLGSGLGKKTYGTHLEILPVKANIKYGGPESPLSIKISGKTGARLITDSMRSLGDNLKQVREKARSG